MAKTPISIWKERTRHFSFWWATAGGIGLMRPAPGTWGSLAATILGYYLIEILSISSLHFVITIVAISLVSVFQINQIEKLSGIHDASEIVIDEVAGQWIALLPCLFMAADTISYLIAFAAFRLFDIWKPWPIGPLDKKVDGGFGVMIDDMVAGLFAAAILSVYLIVF